MAHYTCQLMRFEHLDAECIVVTEEESGKMGVGVLSAAALRKTCKAQLPAMLVSVFQAALAACQAQRETSDAPV